MQTQTQTQAQGAQGVQLPAIPPQPRQPTSDHPIVPGTLLWLVPRLNAVLEAPEPRRTLKEICYHKRNIDVSTPFTHQSTCPPQPVYPGWTFTEIDRRSLLAIKNHLSLASHQQPQFDPSGSARMAQDTEPSVVPPPLPPQNSGRLRHQGQQQQQQQQHLRQQQLLLLQQQRQLQPSNQQQHLVAHQGWGHQQPQPQFAMNSNQQHPMASNFPGGHQSQYSFGGQYSQMHTGALQPQYYVGGQYQNTIAQPPPIHFGSQQNYNTSHYGRGQYFPSSNGAFLQRATGAPPMPGGQQLSYIHRNGGQQQPNPYSFPSRQQAPANSSHPSNLGSFQLRGGDLQQSPSGQQDQTFLGRQNMQQQSTHGQQPSDALPDDYEDSGETTIDEEWPSMYGKPDFNFETIENPPEGLVNDPVYEQTVHQVRTLQKQFNASPKNQTLIMPALRPSLSQHKRGLEEMGELDFDDEDFDEAVHEAKRRRTAPKPQHFFEAAQKVFTEQSGPVHFLVPEEMDQDEPEFNGLDLDLQILGLGHEFKGVHDGTMLSLAKPRRTNAHRQVAEPKPRNPNFRLFESACSSFWLMIEITKHLRVKDIVNLYSVSRKFHGLVNSRFQSTIAAWAQHLSPAGWKIFYWKFYGKYTIQDPSGLTWAAPGPIVFPRPVWDVKPRLASNKSIRRVPSFKYLAMLEQRETRTRDILACLARAGHRLPKTAHATLKKIWLLMDCATNAQRRGFIHNRDIWTDRDLYNAQMFFIKLHMRFNEPIFGPNSPLLADTFLGSKDGLTPLWKLLRRKGYTDPIEVIQQRLRYWVPAEDVDHWRLIGGSGEAYWNVPPSELGEEHREGWGAGNLHMMRPDELVLEECVRREIEMQDHIVFMVFWGHVDFQRRINLVPTEEEMHMSDEEDEPALPSSGPFSNTGTFGRCGNVPFEYDDWQPKHAMKARWKTLTRAEKLWIVKDDEREQDDALVWEEDGDGFWNDFNVNDYPDPEEEDKQEALRQIKPSLNPFERKVIDNCNEITAQGKSIGKYAGLISMTGSIDSFFDPDSQTGEPDFSISMGEDDQQGDEEQSTEYAYQDEEIPPIPHNVTDPSTIAKWADMDPYLHNLVIQEHKRLELQERKDKRTQLYLQRQEERKNKNKQLQLQQGQGEEQNEEPPPTPSYHYDYPSITDPHLRSLLRRYNQFPPEAFGDQFPTTTSPENGKENSCEDMDKDDWEDADDEGLKALGDVDYDSDELDFDIDVYQKFLDRVGGNTESRRRQASGSQEDDANEEQDMGNDQGNEEDTINTTAHEADVDEDDDIPFPKYEFRHF